MGEASARPRCKSIAPALIYEEENLVKRAIRDLYDKDIDEIVRSRARRNTGRQEFMKLFMPSHAKKVQLYEDSRRRCSPPYGVEDQLAQIHQPIVPLKSGGYLVINQTEALVAIDVNSGRSTRERNIEETALRPTWRPPTRSPASCVCATSPA